MIQGIGFREGPERLGFRGLGAYDLKIKFREGPERSGFIGLRADNLRYIGFCAIMHLFAVVLSTACLVYIGYNYRPLQFSFVRPECLRRRGLRFRAASRGFWGGRHSVDQDTRSAIHLALQELQNPKP